MADISDQGSTPTQSHLVNIYQHTTGPEGPEGEVGVLETNSYLAEAGRKEGLSSGSQEDRGDVDSAGNAA